MVVFLHPDTFTVFFGPSRTERFNPPPANGVTEEEEETSFYLEVSSLRFIFVIVQCVFLGGAKSGKDFCYYNNVILLKICFFEC